MVEVQVQVRPYAEADEAAVIDLWHRSGVSRPWNDPRRDIAHKLREQPELFLVGARGARIVATAASASASRTTSASASV